MTIRELYDWAKENGCSDKTLAKHCNGEIFDIETVIDIGDIDFYHEYGIDKVILD